MDNCSICGADMLSGPPITPGSNGSWRCPHLMKNWHIEATKDIKKQSQFLHLRKENMNEYKVTFQITGEVDEYVHARNAEEAIKQAKLQIDDFKSSLPLNWQVVKMEQL